MTLTGVETGVRDRERDLELGSRLVILEGYMIYVRLRLCVWINILDGFNHRCFRMMKTRLKIVLG